MITHMVEDFIHGQTLPVNPQKGPGRSHKAHPSITPAFPPATLVSTRADDADKVVLVQWKHPRFLIAFKIVFRAGVKEDTIG